MSGAVAMRAAEAAPRVLVVCTDYGPPWNEGEKNIARVLDRTLPRHGVEVSVCSKRDPDPTLPSHHRPSAGQLFDNFRFWTEVGRTARERRVDVVHVLTSLSSALGLKSFCIKRLSGARVVLHVTGLARPTRGYRMLLSADRVVVGGAYLQPYFPAAEALPPISPHVSAELGTVRVPGPRSDTGERVLYLGSMEQVRGVHTVVDAVARLAEVRPRLTLTIAWNGDGNPDYERGIRARVEARGLQGRVRWVGIVPDLGRLYQEHDLVVIPPISQERMGFPLRLIEALSYGRPVVASDVGELPVAAEGCGLIFPREDVPALAAAIERMLTDPELYRQSAERALERARRYDPARTVARLAAIYREVAP